MHNFKKPGMECAGVEASKDFGGLTNEELLTEYQKTGELSMKQELVMRYVYIVRSIAIQMRDVYVSFAQIEDIVNEGVLVIMSALDKFDPEKNVKFETYISKRIKGMVIDMARKQDWIPRSVRKNARDIDEVTTKLYNELGRYPTPEEVAGHMNMSLEKYQEAQRKTTLFNVLSLDLVLDDGGESKKTVYLPSKNENEQPELNCLKKEAGEILAEGIRSLKENEQLVISLYYVEELNMKQIAEVMSISEPRVSQIHANAVKKLKTYLNKEYGEENR